MRLAAFRVVLVVRKLLQALGVRWIHIAPTVALLIVSGLLEASAVGLMVPLLTMFTDSGGSNNFIIELLSRVAPGDRRTQMMLLAAVVLGVITLKNVIAYAASVLGGNVRRTSLVRLRAILLDRVMNAAPEKLEAYTTGDVNNAFLSDAARVGRVLDLCIVGTQRVILVLSYFVALIVISHWLTAGVILIATALGGLAFALSRKAVRLSREVVTANAALASFITESVGGLKVLRSTATQKQRAEAFQSVNDRHSLAEVKSSLAAVKVVAITETLAVVGAMLVTTAAYTLFVAAGKMEAPQFLAFGFGLIRLLPGLNQLYSLQALVASLLGSVERVFSWLELPQFPRRPFGARRFSSLSRDISFAGVSFGYAGREPVLRKLSFTVPTHAFVAVVGPSGAGKSTLANLLLRMREPTAGRILFDGVDHWEFTPQEYHRKVAYVEQEPFLFHATLFENLTVGATDATREDVLAVLEKVSLGEFVRQLPNGLDTVVAERGSSISGGQKQRFAIARAIIRNPQVLIMDEPTSALDAGTEREIVKTIHAASANLTTFVITHRPDALDGVTHTLRLPEGTLTPIDGTSPVTHEAKDREEGTLRSALT